MHTQAHDSIPDRRLEPRRLLPRRRAAPHANNPSRITKWLQEFNSERPHRFQAGDEVTFETADGLHRTFYILGFDGYRIDAFFYDGNPHLVQLSDVDVDDLRIVSLSKYLDAKALNTYRALVGLDVDRTA